MWHFLYPTIQCCPRIVCGTYQRYLCRAGWMANDLKLLPFHIAKNNNLLIRRRMVCHSMMEDMTDKSHLTYRRWNWKQSGDGQERVTSWYDYLQTVAFLCVYSAYFHLSSLAIIIVINTVFICPFIAINCPSITPRLMSTTINKHVTRRWMECRDWSIHGQLSG